MSGPGTASNTDVRKAGAASRWRSSTTATRLIEMAFCNRSIARSNHRRELFLTLRPRMWNWIFMEFHELKPLIRPSSVEIGQCSRFGEFVPVTFNDKLRGNI